MDKLFIEILNMSITAGYCVLAVVLIRLLLKKFPKIYSYMLWAVVFFRLVCPVSIKSVFSLLRFNTNVVSESLGNQGTAGFNNDNTISGAINNIQGTAGLNDSGTSDVVNNAANNISNSTTGNIASDTVNQTVSDVTSNVGSIEAGSSLLQNIITVVAIVWLVVALGLIVYSIVSAIRLKKKLENAVHIEANIYEVEGLSTPFVFGFIKPGIYLPSSLAEPERSFVLKHELTHLRRKDYIIKQIAFFIVCVHWFNPLAWLAFCLMSKDMEMSCDESVIAKLSKEEKADYSETLLSLAADKRVVGLSPLAFGEGNVKGRIKNVLNYKKPMLWVTVVIVTVLTVVLVGLAVNPEDKETGGESLEVESSSEETESSSATKTIEAENTSETEVAETETTTVIEPMNDPVEVIESYVEYMGHDWNSLAMLRCAEDVKDFIINLNDAEHKRYNIGLLNVNDAELLELVEIDFEHAKQFISKDYENKTVRSFTACIDYSTNEDNYQYSNGIQYDVIVLVLEEGLWKVSEVESTGRYVTALVNTGYELSEEHVAAAVEKQEWIESDFGADELDKSYRGDAVMYYDMEERIVEGHKLEMINDEDYDVNNLIKVSYYEQSDVSLYSYEVDMVTDDGFEYTSYNLLLEHNGIYQAFTDDDNIWFGNMFDRDSGFPEVYDREFDEGCEMDCDGDGELELLKTIIQDFGTSGYYEVDIVVFDYNAENGLYDFYYIERIDFYDMVEEAAKKFIDEYYGDYSIDKYDRYMFDDGYMITVWDSMNINRSDEDSYIAHTTVWGNPWDEGGLGNEIGAVTFNIRYIGNGQFAVKADKYQQWS